MSSIIVNRELAKLDTIIRFSLCCLVNSLSSVKTVIPMIPFMGVRISCDMLARNSDLDRLASSAVCLADVFFSMDSRKLNTIWLILVLSESISPEASTVMKRVKSPSVAAAEI
jgi:hypothetical protein